MEMLTAEHSQRANVTVKEFLYGLKEMSLKDRSIKTESVVLVLIGTLTEINTKVIGTPEDKTERDACTLLPQRASLTATGEMEKFPTEHGLEQKVTCTPVLSRTGNHTVKELTLSLLEEPNEDSSAAETWIKQKQLLYQITLLSGIHQTHSLSASQKIRQ